MQQNYHAGRWSRFGTWLSLDRLWLLSLLSLIWLFLSITPMPPNDLWWHMAAGRAMIEEGQWITTNRWAYSVPFDAPYIYQSWLSEIILYGAWRLGDVPLLALTRMLAITLSYALVSWYAWQRTGHARAAVLALLLAVMVGWNNWTLRPQTLAMLPGALLIVLLGSYLDGRLSRGRLLLGLPLTMLVWVNLHGSFLLGVALVGLTWLGTLMPMLAQRQWLEPQARRRLRDLSLAGGLVLLALLFNPLGFGIFGYVRMMLGNGPLQRWFIEWQPPQNDFNLRNTGFWFYTMLLLLAVLMARSKRRPSAIDLLWYSALAWLTIGGVRYAIWFALALLPLLAERLALIIPPAKPARGLPGIHTIYAASLLALILASLPWFMPARWLGNEHLFAQAGPYRFLLGNTTPIAASEWLADQPISGRFWTDMSYSSYTIWRMPERQVFSDLRVELFPVSVWQDYFAISRGDQQSLQLIDKWQIEHLLLAYDSDLARLLAATPGWCMPYQDSLSVVMQRCP